MATFATLSLILHINVYSYLHFLIDGALSFTTSKHKFCYKYFQYFDFFLHTTFRFLHFLITVRYSIADLGLLDAQTGCRITAVLPGRTSGQTGKQEKLTTSMEFYESFVVFWKNLKQESDVNEFIILKLLFNKTLSSLRIKSLIIQVYSNLYACY